MQHDRHQSLGFIERGGSSTVELAGGCEPKWSDTGPETGDIWGNWTTAAARVLIVAPTVRQSALSEVARVAGVRVVDVVQLDKAADCLSAFIDIDVVVMDCHIPSSELHGALSIVQDRLMTGGRRLVLIADMNTLDAIDAAVGNDRRVTLLCMPSAVELGLAIQAASRVNSNSHVVREAGTVEGANLAVLSEELRQLRAVVELLARDRQAENNGRAHFHAPPRDFRPMPDAHPAPARQSEITSGQVRAMIRARRLREQLLPGDLFADPAWDIMLDLMAAELEGMRVSVSSLCIAAAVPPTTALRWIKLLTERGLLERRADNNDGRRVFIALTVEGYRAVERWFQASRNMLLEAAG